jgi:hypothetical protein
MKYEDVVPASETGAIRGDGSGKRRFDTTPKTAAHNVTTNAARHATGEALARVGNIRPGQSEPSGNRPITGVPPGVPIRSMAPRPSIQANQAETSSDLEKRLMARPQPFTYEGGAATLYPGSVNWNPSGAVPYDVHTDPDSGPQVRGGGHAPMSDTDAFAAVGYSSGATKSSESIISGFPTRGNQRQAGRPGSRNSNTSSRENSRMRQEP